MNLRTYPEYFGYEKVFGNIKKCNSLIENVGIISVIHRYNKDTIIPFMERFIDSNIKNLTLNKYQSSTGEMNVDFRISEMEYVDTLIFITKYWIANKLHRTIRTFVTTSQTIYRRKFRKDV